MAASVQNSVPLSGVSAIFIASMGDQVGFIVFEISAASTLSCVPQMQVNADGVGPTSCFYYNLLADPRTAINFSTPITANGIYAVFAPGCAVYLTPTAGTATASWKAVYGSTL